MPGHFEQVSPSARLLRREIVDCNIESGQVEVRYLAQQEFTNRHGTVQGGFLAAMLDSATAIAVTATLPPEDTAVTTRLDVSFIKPARPGLLHSKARVCAREGKNATAEAEIMDTSGTVLATARAELRIISSGQ
jgi:uncharacterized protein (TIGR00369 family)